MIDDTSFGLGIDNPITLTSVPISYSYLKHLILEDGSEISYKRRGSRNTIDLWEIYDIETGSFLATIYINCYAKENTDKCPKGFKFREYERQLLH